MSNTTKATVTVTIEDTGYGIPEHKVKDIFKVFYRVTEHEGIALGTGLGLAIVKMLVEAHDGTITVESAVDVGSTFIVTLPLKNA